MHASKLSAAMVAAGLAQMRLGEADEAPPDLAIVAAVHGVGKESFQRERVQRAKHRFLWQSPCGDLAVREQFEADVLLGRRQRDEGLAVSAARPEIEEARHLFEGGAQLAQIAGELTLDEAADFRFARTRPVLRRHHAPPPPFADRARLRPLPPPS